MTSGMTAFMVAVSGTSLAIFLLMGRTQNRSARRQSAGGDGPGSSYESGTGTGGEGWNPFSWISASDYSSDSSDTSGDSGSDGGGDGGGGDGGGGGD